SPAPRKRWTGASACWVSPRWKMIKTIQSPVTSRSQRLTRRRVALAAVTVAIIALAIGIAVIGDHPRSDRQWIPQQAVMAHADIRGDSVFVMRVRNFSYT